MKLVPLLMRKRVLLSFRQTKNSASRCLSVVIAILVLSSCSSIKNDLFEAAIDFERSSAGLEFGKITVDGRHFAYLESTRGDSTSAYETTKPYLVLLHGFAANKDNWLRFSEPLTKKYHIVAVDLLGHGDSQKDFDIKYDLLSQATYLKRFLNTLSVDNFHLAGNSMGGAVASVYAATYPQEVLSVTLFNSAGIYDHQSEFGELLLAGKKNPLIVEKEADFDSLLEFAMTERPFIPWPVKSILAEKAVANKAINDRIFTFLVNDQQYDFSNAIQKIRAPTLIIWGNQDRVIHYRNAEVFAKLIPGAKKVILEGVGHAPMIEVPEISAQLVDEFISKHE